MALDVVTADPASVLVVDDNVDVREGLCDLLVEEGFRVRAAVDGVNALAELAIHGLPDVILLDLRMPKMDGYEFLRQLAVAGREFQEVPIIVVSATLDKPLPLPVADILRKPPNPSVLVDVVRREVVKRRA